MLFMRNRSGVVFQRNEGLLSDPTLDFAVCDIHGNDLAARDQLPKEFKPPVVPKVAQTKKSTKKAK